MRSLSRAVDPVFDEVVTNERDVVMTWSLQMLFNQISMIKYVRGNSGTFQAFIATIANINH